MKIKYYLKEMRLHHYLKNLLIFAPLACSGQLFVFPKLLSAFYSFLSFCFTSSAIYVINDIRDVEKDRNHPIKCNRPIAAGKITNTSAMIFAVLLLALGIVFNVLCFNVRCSLILLTYFLINLGYSFGLKNIPLLDIVILAAGFLLRASIGAVATEITISNWLYLVVISAAFYLGLGKRRNEMKKHVQDETRTVIKYYSISFLESNMYVCMALIFVFYALWTVDEKTVAAFHHSRLIWTVPIVILIFMKYSLTIEGDSDGDPVEVLVRDKALLALCGLYFLLMFALLYVFR